MRHSDVKLGGVGEQWRGDPGSVGGRGDVERACVWCGRAFRSATAVGRPAKYCRRSCRQRAYEARRHAGDLDWSDRRLTEMARRHAELEDAVDRVKEIVEELAVDAAEGAVVDLGVLVDQLTLAIEVG